MIPVLLAATESADIVVCTRDWHPPNHCSFAAFGGPWPTHCVQGTRGAEIEPNLLLRADHAVSKGERPNIEQYSGCDGTELVDVLRKRAIDAVLFGGLATDYCVKATVLDLLAAGVPVTVLTEGCRAVEVEPGDGERALAAMAAAGASTR